MTGSKRQIAATALALVVTSCARVPELAVKPLPTVLAQGRLPVSFRVAEAAGQFALGNVALALESYRKALREEPASIDAQIGIAACYDSLGRFDLSGRHYEEALALAPTDAHLLEMFAASLLQQGRVDEAAGVRREATDRLTPPAHPFSAAASSNMSVPAVGELNQAGHSVTLELPAAHPSSELTVLKPALRVEPAGVAETSRSGPRLERLSLGEVALITTPQRTPRPPIIKSSSPVRSASSTAVPLLLLNAARSEGLAARARRYLSTRGFAMALVGDAPRIRARTLIIAPAADRARALRLSRTFSVTPQMVLGHRLTLILGRDVLSQRALHA
jgi:Tfp pilus assembly protein PilF